MQIQSVHSVQQQQSPSGPKGPLASFANGDILQAEVAGADQGQVVLRLPQGDLIKAGQRTMDPLQTGDVVLLQVAQEEGEPAPRLELISVNGQPLKAGAPPLEYALLRMQVPPSRANLAIAAALSEMGAPALPETFSRMAELSARFPALPADLALLLAASSLPLSVDTVEAFTSWLQTPLHTTDLAASIETLAAQDGQAAPLLEAALHQMEEAVTRMQARSPAPQQAVQMPVQAAAAQAALGALPPGLSPALAARLEQSGIWQELGERLPSLPAREAQGLILQLMSDLPVETSGAERSLLYQALQALRAPAPGARAMEQPGGNPWAHGTETPLPQDTPEAGSGPAGQERPALLAGLRSLFAALLEQAPGEQGPALREAASRLETRLLAFTNALQEEGGKGASLKPVLDMGQALATQVQMGGELGNLLYVPLPITLREARQEAGLYVLKRNGGSKKVDEANIIVAICLETRNLGPVDTLLKVERNDITLQFRVESAGARAFIQAELALAPGLSFPLPYRFQSACVVLRDAPITPLNAAQTLQRAFSLPTSGALDISV